MASKVERASLLRTPRMVLRPFALGDVLQLLELFRQPAVRRYLLDDHVASRDWVVHEVRKSRSMFAIEGCGLWSLLRKGGDGIDGFCGYREFHDPPELQLVCGISQPWRGGGLATEACREVVRFGFDELGMTRIVAEVDLSNDASIRLMERLGMELEAQFTVAGRDTARYLLAPGESAGRARLC